MDESVHEALAFNEEVEKEQSDRRKTVLNALFAAALAGLWFILSQWGKGMPWWVSLGLVVVCVGAALWVGAQKRDVRAGYRQDPFAHPQPDKKYYFGIILIFAPTFFQTFLEGHMGIAAVVVTLWGLAVFWVLNSGAMDLSTRNTESNKRASDER
ncbi:hypothetical protein L8V01_04300 [Corynebacterium sp. c8Ua_181]|uniref:Uncharacterized protein n=1 Tax=Corynebacterium curieae TaxID=2913500 RepID=A0A9X3MBN6_9CORY|nr:hypothetical protein [Corynebacterium curieae]MCZ9306700.1 hypothetical protein [Corynebacterium curieae]MDV2424726.1 hypothetical protein [Corynebacterium curieae]